MDGLTLRCPRCGNQNLVSESEPNNAGLEVIKRKCPSCFTSFYLAEDIMMWLSALNNELAATRAKTAPAK